MMAELIAQRDLTLLSWLKAVGEVWYLVSA